MFLSSSSAWALPPSYGTLDGPGCLRRGQSLRVIYPISGNCDTNGMRVQVSKVIDLCLAGNNQYRMIMIAPRQQLIARELEARYMAVLVD
jgi:hypothetical protein